MENNEAVKKIEEQIAKNKKLPKEVEEKINKNIYRNIIFAVLIMLGCNLLLFGYKNLDMGKYLIDLKVMSVFMLILTLVVFERAYKKDTGKLWLNGVEVFVLSLCTLALPYIHTYYIYNFPQILFLTCLIFAIYYSIKAIIILCREKSAYIKSLNDIEELVKDKEKVPHTKGMTKSVKEVATKKAPQKDINKKTNLDKKHAKNDTTTDEENSTVSKSTMVVKKAPAKKAETANSTEKKNQVKTEKKVNMPTKKDNTPKSTTKKTTTNPK